MAKIRIVLGDTGTGKTYSLRNLDPEKTYIVQAVEKDLSFRGSRKTYNVDNKNITVTGEYHKVIKLLNGIDKQLKHIETVVLDDVGFIMQKEFFARAEEGGFNKFGEMGKHMQEIIKTANSLKHAKNVFLLFHDDDDNNDRKKVKKKLKLIGQMLEDKYNPLAVADVVLYSIVEFDDDDLPQYKFITNRTRVDKIVIPAKTPAGMFKDLRIDNDLEYVIKEIDKYYE